MKLHRPRYISRFLSFFFRVTQNKIINIHCFNAVISGGLWPTTHSGCRQINRQPQDNVSQQIKLIMKHEFGLLLQTVAYIIKYLVNILTSSPVEPCRRCELLQQLQRSNISFSHIWSRLNDVDEVLHADYHPAVLKMSRGVVRCFILLL